METTSPTNPSSGDPNEETSIVRTGPEAVILRNRIERPARVGRLILAMLGVVTAGAGIAIWITNGTAVGVAITTFGGVLLVLGVVQHFLFRRDEAYWPEQAHLWTDGVELVLHNGEIRGASWSDPDFGLQLISRRAHSPIGREFMLIWLMDPKVPPVELTAQGFEQLQQRAANHGLDLTQSRKGSRADSTQLIHIHPGAAAAAAARANGTETIGPG